jgi:hypothetical protein
MKRRPWTLRVAALVAAGVLSSAAAYGTSDEGVGAVDPKAAELVRRMAGYLSGLDAFRVLSETTIEVVLEDGQKLQFGNATLTTVRRPDRLRADRRGDLAGASLYYDGGQVTLYGTSQQYYASAAAPASLDELLGFLEERLDMAAPAADLLHSDGGAGLLEAVQSGLYVGRSEVSGVPCHHLAFRAEEVDWQVWIEDGERPLPRKYVITTRDVEGSPQFAVELGDWDVAPTVSDEDFLFVPPEGATKIEFDMPDGAGEEEAGS